MKSGKILVVGAGHGGLIAAGKLSRAGFDVKVLEAQAREDVGHDAEDRFTFSLLEELIGMNESDFPQGSTRVRGNSVFPSPSQKTRIEIDYDASSLQKLMWRKPLINMLIDYAESCGVKIEFGIKVTAPIVKNSKIVGVKTDADEYNADMVIDSAGVFSPIRMKLPKEYNIEKEPKYGDLFFAYRAYFDVNNMPKNNYPFEVYLYHEGERGLSWFGNDEKDNMADILIGRIYPLTEKKVNEQLAIFKKKHPWLGDRVMHGGKYGVIPVRRPLTLMVGEGYACVGDSAFMTTPMNGMGIDISMKAGKLLAETLIAGRDFSAKTLWNYNRTFHQKIGGDIAKNEGLKNSLLKLPSVGVDFLYDNGIIQSSDLAGAGKKTSLKSLLGKFVRGMKNPGYFFTILGGIIRGARVAKLYKSAPKQFDRQKIEEWSKKISSLDVIIPKE